MVHIGNDWDAILEGEFDKPYYKKLRAFLKSEYSSRTVYPDMNDIFNALRYTSFENTKVCILGQDPYHEPGQAHGLCFSVKEGVQPPPSLLNIYKEIKTDTGTENPSNFGELTCWAKQGVLLLNTVLTVRRGAANSHKGMGWEQFTDRVISELNRKQTPVIFLLWGRNARDKAQIITNPLHVKLCCAHPSPLSAYNGFFGCRHFSAANRILRENGLEEIDWSVKKV